MNLHVVYELIPAALIAVFLAGVVIGAAVRGRVSVLVDVNKS